MSKPIYTTQVKRLSHECRGIGKITEKTAFVRGALPGETADCQLVKKHRQYVDAIAVDIQNPSPDRITPKCPHFLTCGGCSLQHIKPEAQVAYKQMFLLEQLKHSGKSIPQTILEPVTGPTFAYRHKARLGVRHVFKKEKLLVGFREVQGRYLADIEHCDILPPQVGYQLRALANLIMSLSVLKEIPQVEVAIGEDQTALIFRHLKPLTHQDLKKLTDFGALEKIDIYLQPGNEDTVHKVFPESGDDRLHYTLPEYELTMRFHPNDFTQVNPKINQKMIARALQLLELNSKDRVLDLFCGLGNFTLPMARFANHVTGIEGSEKMVQRAQENAEKNNIYNTTFAAFDLTQDLATAAFTQLGYDKLLIDPPRSGAQEIIRALGPKQVKRIVYISCNPATLARDTEILTQDFGYTLKSAGILDMFPQTSHVESIALFDAKA